MSHRALLSRLTAEIRQSLNGSLVGLQVYGSLVTGDFDKDRSDIDLLAVIGAGLDGETFDRLDIMHAFRKRCVSCTTLPIESIRPGKAPPMPRGDRVYPLAFALE